MIKDIYITTKHHENILRKENTFRGQAHDELNLEWIVKGRGEVACAERIILFVLVTVDSNDVGNSR